MSDPSEVTTERGQRQAKRDEPTDVHITSQIQLADGTTLEGVAKDVSDTGVKISGLIEGLSIGDEVDLILVVLNENVHYRAEVRHIAQDEASYGLKFLSRLPPVERQGTKCCGHCRQEFPLDANFCSFCGERLPHH